MNNLDQFFKDKFQNREFEFQEAYWEEAQAMIEADRRRTRRGLWWYWGLGVVLLLGLGWGAYAYWSPATDVAPPAAALTENPSTITKPIQPAPATQNDTGNKTDANNTTNAFPNLSPTNTDHSTTTTATQKNVTSESQASNSSSLNPEISGRSNTNTNIKNNTPVNATTIRGKQSPTTRSTEKTAKSTAITPVADQLLPSKPTSTNPSPASSKQEVATAIKNDVANAASAEDNSKAPLSDADQSLANAESPVLDPNTTKTQELSLLATLAAIPAEPLAEVLAEEPPLAQPSLSTYRPHWTWGATISSEIYPAQSGEQLWIGAASGLSLRYQWTRRWSVQSDILYQQRRGQFGSAGSSPQRRYGFGLQEKTIVLQPNALHYLEWPIYVQVKNARQRLELGASVNYLLGVRGNLVENTFLQPWERGTRSSPQNPKVETKTLEKGWLDSDAFRSVQLGILLGYRYTISPQWNVGLQAKYQLSSMVKDNTIDPEISPVLRESGALHFRLGLTYFPFAR